MKMNLREKWLESQKVKIEVKDAPKQPEPVQEAPKPRRGRINKLLSYLDFQERVGDSWVVTEEGKPYAVILDTGKKHKSGTMVQQIKWKESVIPKLEKLLDDDDD